MGTPILPDIIDAEIIDIVNTHLNEAFDFVQTIGCCSGWSSSIKGEDASDGVNRVWRGSPYIIIEISDNVEGLGKLVPYILSNMIFDDPYNDRTISKYNDYKNKLKTVNITDDGKQLLHTTIEYRKGKIQVSFYINTDGRQPSFIEKIWNLFRNVLIEYKNSIT